MQKWKNLLVLLEYMNTWIFACPTPNSKNTKNIEINLVVSIIIRTFAAVLRHNDFCGKAKEKNFVGLPEKIS